MTEQPHSAEGHPVETQISRLESMFCVVSDPATKQDCATVTLETKRGQFTIEYGAFRDGDVLNVPTPTEGYEIPRIIERVRQSPMDTDVSRYVAYDVNDLDERDVAELVFDASGSCSSLEIATANLRTIEPGGIVGLLFGQLKPNGRTSNECHICGTKTENGLATCTDCQSVVPEKQYVLECEWCDKCWYSDFKIWNTIRSALHARREHPDKLEEDYG